MRIRNPPDAAKPPPRSASLLPGPLPALRKRTKTPAHPQKGCAGAVPNGYTEGAAGPDGAARGTGASCPQSSAMSAQSTRSPPQKKRATVPGPVWLPMVVPIQLISTLPFSLGNRASTRSATARASSWQADWLM